MSPGQITPTVCFALTVFDVHTYNTLVFLLDDVDRIGISCGDKMPKVEVECIGWRLCQGCIPESISLLLVAMIAHFQSKALGGTTWNKGKRHPTLEDGVIIGAGAKILGPFTVHKNAKVGSNAVVTKEVPEGVTAVGNPARYIYKDKDKNVEEARRRDYAQQIGFQPYAASQDQTDPILEGIRMLMDRMQSNEQRMNTLCQRLSLLDPTFKRQQTEQQPYSAEELKIIEELS